MTERNVIRHGDMIVVHAVKPGDLVTLYSVDGKMLHQVAADANGDASVSLSALGQGVYLLNINKFTTKIIKP